MNGRPGPPSAELRDRPALLRLAWPLLVLVLIEFFLGMALNLFVALPTGAGAVAILESSPVLVLHVLIAIALVGISARAVRMASRLKDRELLGVTGLALVSAIVAALAGAGFTFGGQAPDASFGMAVGFGGILIAAFLLLARGLPDPGPPGASFIASRGPARPDEVPP
ncbi:MAG: hypothetical protein L3K08_02565 [Thermoplasmata archaeon]|nr:hypothetical protein [Thermoplasmata archaeon]